MNARKHRNTLQAKETDKLEFRPRVRDVSAGSRSSNYLDTDAVRPV